LIRRFSVGRIDCVIVSDGQPEPPFEPQLAEFFAPESGVPIDELREVATLEGNARTTLTLGYNSLLIDAGAGWAIVDPGLGAKFLDYGTEIEPLVGHLTHRLGEAGLGVDAIGAVLFTHLHHDHTRGAIWSGQATFPEATAFAHKAEVAYWSDAPASATAAPHRECASAAIHVLDQGLRTFDYGVEVVHHVRAVDASGHSPGHTAFALESQGRRLLCVGDTFYDPLHVSHPQWRTPWDHEAEPSVRSRRRLLGRAADEKLLVHAYHMPFPGLGVIKRRDDTFMWSPVSEP
jgi:glyoxylase-like metal-dependent hydrolase (beta-lactamase superfamily II)